MVKQDLSCLQPPHIALIDHLNCKSLCMPEKTIHRFCVGIACFFMGRPTEPTEYCSSVSGLEFGATTVAFGDFRLCHAFPDF